MKKVVFIYMVVFLVYFDLFGQNNYVFNGGISQGFNKAHFQASSNNSIFSGGSEDGFDKSNFSNMIQLWPGGIEDGFSYGLTSSTINNSIFQGSNEDGMAFMTFAKKDNNDLFHGGIDDGFSMDLYAKKDNNELYAGGEGDGFSASGISKLIWDGDLSKDWLMADNWNIPIVPTMNHSVCIPSGVPRYPELSAILGISIKDAHTYASSDVEIMAGAEINGIENVQVIVNGKLMVAGDLFLNAGEPAKIIGRSEGLIEIQTGGSIQID